MATHLTAQETESRYNVQAVVDKSEPVASAVLVSAVHLLKDNTEIVKRWTSEIQEVVMSKSGMMQFHALSLLHALRAKDRLAVSKLVSSMTRSKLFHPMAQMMLVRYVAQVPQPTHRFPAALHAAVSTRSFT